MHDPILERYAPALKEACLEVFRSNTPRYFVPGEESEFAGFLDEPDGAYYVGRLADAVVACGGWAANDDGSCAMTWGMVHADRHGEQLGQWLLDQRIENAREAGYRRFRIETSPPVAGFFAKSGFRTIEQQKDGIAPGLDRVIMVLDG